MQEQDEMLRSTASSDDIKRMANGIRGALISAFSEALNEDDFEAADKIVTAYQKYKAGTLALQKRAELLLHKTVNEVKDDSCDLSTKEGRAAFRARLVMDATETQ